jgi:2-succinyl-6-hydroxy-2,4-cyclohexadiene-1-carboxylate synthase
VAIGPVVFIPGFMQRGDAWARVARTVGERYPSVSLDPRAPTFAARVRELLAEAPPDAVPVGYSFGGRVALHAALQAPNRFGALVLVGASAGIEDGDERERRRRDDERLAAWIERTPIEQVVERWERNPVFATQAPELVEAQRPGRLSHDPAELASLLRTGGQGALAPVWDELPGLELPVLCVAGERDKRYAAAAERMAGALQDGSAALVSGAGHAPQIERPDEVARLLVDFVGGG